MNLPARWRGRRGSRRWWLVGAIGVALWWWLAGGAPPPFPGGYPRAEGAWDALTTRHLVNPGFVIGYSEALAAPRWVAFELRPGAMLDLPPRPRHFTEDRRALHRTPASAYRGSGFDRGHLAPNYAIARQHGPDALRASFRLSNVVPQRPALNQLLWQKLEEAEVDVVRPRVDALWVLTGPIGGTVRGGLRVPEAMFRVWQARIDGDWALLAFRVPQTVCGGEPPSRFLVSVDALEAELGLDLMPEDQSADRARREAEVRADDWPMREIDALALRYGDRFDLSACPPGAA